MKRVFIFLSQVFKKKNIRDVNLKVIRNTLILKKHNNEEYFLFESYQSDMIE